ncbi:threo-3-hydroxy-L-aspartate ammonia-lyase [Streptomyces tsukubensis]|uniref:threonine ammonia-lyase n=1 Tax=Streptomyces tsukubensis TaxID=83656 RepID=A0A1V4A7X4_9ACTN|nr:threo-3-hydroxy-L-aspartate ammonia-lyase [Streptomyces tsukubensis]OON78049.1 serine dehydratase [Streptomyces tsukubensis]QFR97213.1 threo-3-hydroxy-L-aspartate ammonia-lyase [Streptomyces tsukubensis]
MLTSPTYDDVEAAAARVAPQAHRTPVLRSSRLDAGLGVETYFKCENFQRMGAFKFRGAFNALSRLSPEQRRAGAVAYSSGNHAQAVALSARLLDMASTIVMPHDAPESKVAATEGYGGRIVRYDRYDGDPAVIAKALAEEGGLAFVPPFDHPDVIAGQATATKELFEETGPLDALFVPIGGGGLISGAAITAEALAPECLLYGVEPEAGDDARQSLRKGEIVTIDTPKTIADGAQTQRLGTYTFDIIKRRVLDVLTASDESLVECMRTFATLMKLVVEPTGCLGLAALRAHAEPLRGRRVGVIISGGNVDLARYASLLAG